MVSRPRYLRQSEKKLSKLQRKVSRQWEMNKNNPDWEGKNWQKTQKKIAKLHEKITRQRRAFNHKLSTYIVRTFDAIAVEDIKISNLNRRPKPKEREDGKGYERNGAKAKSGLNKSFADAGLGQFLNFLETKAKAAKKEFIKVPPHYTSQDCPRCGHRRKKALSQRTHLCSECGYFEQRDIAAAINIRAKADFVRSYPACAGGSNACGDGGLPSSLKQEPSQEGHGGDATTTSIHLLDSRATGEVLEEKTPLNTPQSQSQQAIQSVLPLDTHRATPEASSQKQIQVNTNGDIKKQRRRKHAEGATSAQSGGEIPIQLSFWDMSAEISVGGG